VYASSWKQEEPYPDFIFELCKLARNKGWLRLGTLHVGGEPAAAQLWFVKDGTASIYKLAYDSRFAKLGVGTVLTSALFRHVLDVDKVCEIDFLTGDDAYKSEWMTHSRELIGLVAWDGRNPATLAMALTHFAVKWLKKFVKS
jgi:CelD/BcsL family acetyltransferase involved in cellulose biosynthesis